MTFLDSIATFHKNENYCGARAYDLSPKHTFLTISGSSTIATIKLETLKPSDTNTYPITLTVSLTSYPDPIVRSV